MKHPFLQGKSRSTSLLGFLVLTCLISIFPKLPVALGDTLQPVVPQASLVSNPVAGCSRISYECSCFQSEIIDSLVTWRNEALIQGLTPQASGWFDAFAACKPLSVIQNYLTSSRLCEVLAATPPPPPPCPGGGICINGNRNFGPFCQIKDVECVDSCTLPPRSAQ